MRARLRSTARRGCRRLPSRAILLGLLALALAVGLRVLDPPLLHQARFALFDSYQRLFPRAYEPAPVRIVAIDDAAIERLGQWPWPRADISRLVRRLEEAGAVAVGFAILFADPDRSSLRALALRLAEVPAFADLESRLDEVPDGDMVFANSLTLLPSVTGFSLETRPGGRPPQQKWGLAVRSDEPLPLEDLALPSFPGVVTTLPVLEAVASGNGFLNLVPDSDGVVRRIHLLLDLDDMPVPSLLLELLRVAQGAATYVLTAVGGAVQSVHVGGLTVATGPESAIWLHYTGHRPERYVSAADLLKGDFNRERIEGHVVLLATTASGLRNQRPTALEPAAEGVEIYADALEQIMLGKSLVRPDWATGAELVYMVVLGTALVLLLGRLPPQYSAGLGFFATLGAFADSIIRFNTSGVLLDPLSPSLAVLFVYLVASGSGLAQTERERRHVRKAFERYLAPAVVERLVEARDALVLGGETRELTVLFSDIQGFTGIAEKLDAQSLTHVVNSCMTPLTDAVLAAEGTIDKYMGDAIMAFWNAPLDIEDHPRKACRAALRMAAAMAEVNARLAADGTLTDGGRRLAVGIGINTGPCCVGNMGSEQRFDYSAIGDAVNLASRLEGLCRLYAVEIVVGETTARAAGSLALIELDLIRVKGKQRPERIFALLGDEALAVDPDFGRLASAQAAFLQSYRDCRFADAEKALAAARAADPDGRLKTVFNLYAERLVSLQVESPGPGWDGVFVALTK